MIITNEFVRRDASTTFSRAVYLMRLTVKNLSVCLLALSAFSCADDTDTPSVNERACSKLQTCNALMGVSYSGCVENIEQSLSQLTSAERTDTENAIEACLELNDCGNFLVCVE